MIHPKKIVHIGADYELSHLNGGKGSFPWQTATGRNVTIEVSLVYADHCYSDEKLPRVPGCHIVKSQGRDRIFCPDRHARSLSLPQLFADMFARPTTAVNMTSEQNWAMLYLTMEPPIPTGKRYYIFFHAKFMGNAPNADVLPVEVFVESAYLKDRRVDFRRRAPFGRMIEEAIT